MNNNNSLFSPYQLNQALVLKNRIVMAPMTRSMAADQFVPTAQMAEYYARRTDAGLIVTEGTIIRPDAQGYPAVPGIYTKAQINGWRRVTDAVHAKRGVIFMQIWHVGRVSHPSYLNGELPLAPSATVMMGRVKRGEGMTHGESRAVTLAEINDLIASYAQAAKNAIEAGFDGVEIHGANGYLIDQFLHYHTNHRTDRYGGSPNNMARFALEVVKACGEAIGYERVAIRLSPGAYLNEIIGDARDSLVFEYLLKALNVFSIAYVHTGDDDNTRTYSELGNSTTTAFIRSFYKGTLIACGNYSQEGAKAGIDNNAFDLVAFGRPFIANPDLVNLLRHQHPVQQFDASMLSTLY
ncbi:alkene reductase [Aquicella lusitana]|uniref:2,4-dienoyl-CoA reductase-like NADH-dependent reductase (Old Yellow Enzyme family) n=1 Tax=Aquicella lusitana TaxID=254246 RepID=A0A370GFW8_9COXI|nr:alkene reductase [Aquicella lusitana]RDI42567.1 2,4-dienoyl-CoA reductase-like NADH-dependent reductase (Old Yellow Enzyme family) [Aquicella lusitana]VVC74346.1 N-ethylmaleimide reductase [Aquicella lusitana]